MAVASAAEVLVENPKEDSVDSRALPLKVNPSLTVESWGTLYRGPGEEKYRNSSRGYPYPVGYTSIKNYKGGTFRQTVVESPDGPLFVVEEVGKGVHSADSPSKVWNQVVKEDGQRVQGTRHFGFLNPEVVRVLEALARPSESKEEDVPSENEAHLKPRETDILNKLETVASLNVLDSTGPSAEDSDYVEDETILEEEHDNLFHVYTRDSPLNSEHVEDDSSEFDETGSLLSNFDDSFSSSAATINDDKDFAISDELDKYEGLSSQHSIEESSESDTIDNGAAGYHSQTSRQVWKRGEGLTGYGAGSKKQQVVERPGAEPWNSSSDFIGTQSRPGSTGFRPWEGFSPPRRKDESSKSSQLLMDLLQKWNKIKKWNHDPGDRLRGRGESKQSQLQEESGMPKETKYQDDVGDARANVSVGKSVLQKNDPEFSSRKQDTFRTSNGSLLEDGKSVLEELTLSQSVDESTNYAISRLFETVGRKTGLPNSDKRHSRFDKPLMDEADTIGLEEKSSNQGITSGFTQGLDARTSMQAPDGLKAYRTLVQNEPKMFDFVKARASDKTHETAEKKGGNRPVSLTESLERDIDSMRAGKSNKVTPRLVDMTEKKNRMLPQDSDRSNYIEDVRKLVVKKRFEDAFSVVRGMRLSGLHLDENVYEAVLCCKLDTWQKQVFKHLQDGNSVLVSASGGAGKSVAADCCLYQTLVQDQRALFVTPYENVAKQKFGNFESMFGRSKVGGMWTRMSVHRDRNLIVITLETLAKVLQELNGPGGSEFSFFFEGIKLVVLDKFHTIGDANCCSLWEEVMTLMDPKIAFVALTLPADNEDQIASWIDISRGPCKLVRCQSDPVPKRYIFCNESELIPLLDTNGSNLNNVFAHELNSYNSFMTKEQLESFFWCGYDKKSLRYTFSVLEDNAMLPALVVFFDGKGCADAWHDALDVLGDGLLSATESAKLESQLVKLGESHPDLLKLIDDADRDGLCKGLATLHAGKLPFWHQFVVKLLHEGLVKLLIVTESVLFQTGINVRTTILPAACKVLKDGVSPVPVEQVVQLIGSAGRRGYDVEGNVVFLKNFYSGPKELASLLLDNAITIMSCFKPSYPMVANMLAKHKPSEVKKMLNRSFAEYIYYNTHTKVKWLEELDQKILNCLESKADLEVKLFQGLTDVNKQKLVEASMFTRVDIRMTIHSASQVGNVLPGFLLAVVPGLNDPFYMVFGADNKFRLLPAGSIDHVYTKESPPLDAVCKLATGLTIQPPLIPPKEDWVVEDGGTCGYIASGNSQSKEYVKLLLEHPVRLNAVKEGLHLRKEIQMLETQISNLIGKRRSLQTEKENTVEESSDITPGASYMDQSEIWKESLRLAKVMERFDSLSFMESQGPHVKLKPLGMLISRFHNVENGLWLAVVVTSKGVKSLLPAEFAGLMATMVPLKHAAEIFLPDQRELLYKVTKPMKAAFTELEVLRKHLAALQGSYIPPLHFDAALAGMVYCWARGKPGTGSLSITSTNDGDVAWKLRKVAKLAHLVSEACNQISVDVSEPNEFRSLSTLAKRAEQLLSRYLDAVDNKPIL